MRTLLLGGALWGSFLGALSAQTSGPPFGVVEFPPSREQVLPPEEPKTDNIHLLDVCLQRLKRLGEAIHAYRAEHRGRNPEWLSDLYPNYLSDAEDLLCPADAQRGETGAENDPHLPTSYAYEFAPSHLDAAVNRYRRYGSFVPLVRCWHHLDLPVPGDEGESVPTLDYGGKVETFAPEWEKDSRFSTRLFETIRNGLLSGDASTLASIHFGACDLLSEERRNELEALLLSRRGEIRNGGVQKLLGAFARRAGRTEEAITAYENAARLLPEDPEVFFLLGTLYQQVGRRAEARDAYEHGLRLQPDTVDILRELVFLYVEEKDTGRVQSLYGLLKTVFRPESFGHRLVMGDVAYAAGDVATAQESYEWLVTHYPRGTSLEDPTLRHVVMRLAELYERSGKTDSAEQLRFALEPGRTLRGKSAPPLTGVDAEGNAVSLTPGGKPTVLVFWGSWGASCRMQWEVLRNLKERLETENVTVVGVNASEDVEPEMEFATTYAPFLHIYDAGTGFRAYSIRLIPTTVYVDRYGIVREFESGFQSEERLLERLRPLVGETPR